MSQSTRSGMLLIVLLTALLGSCRTGTRLEVPTPEESEFTRLELSSVFALSEDNVYVCGWLDRADGGVEGLILRSDDAGAHWRRVGAETMPMIGLMPQTLHFADARRGWVAGVRVSETGTNAVVLRTADGGGHWRERTIAEPRAEFISHLEGLAFQNDLEGSIQVVYVDSDTEALVANSYRTQDGGRQWIVDAFRDDVDSDSMDGAWHDFSVDQSYRLAAPDQDGVQALEFSSSAGQSWRRVSLFHISRFAEFYGPWDGRAERAAAADAVRQSP